MAFRGVRSSWLILASKALLAWLAASAAWRASRYGAAPRVDQEDQAADMLRNRPLLVRDPQQILLLGQRPQHRLPFERRAQQRHPHADISIVALGSPACERATHRQDAPVARGRPDRE